MIAFYIIFAIVYSDYKYEMLLDSYKKDAGFLVLLIHLIDWSEG